MKRSARRFLASALSIVMVFSFVCTAQAVETDTALLQNFIPGLWELTGDNGLPESEKMLIGRAINIGVDIDGDAITAVDEQDLRYFEGKYYLYGQNFNPGTFNTAPGVDYGPINSDSVPANYYRYGGFSIYSSDDLMNWKLEGNQFIQNEDTGWIFPVKKPRIVHSEATGKYVLWYLDGQADGVEPPTNTTYRIAESDTPIGPWEYKGVPKTEGDTTIEMIGTGHDFEIVEGPDGDAWLILGRSSQLFRLNKERNGVVDYITLPLAVMGGIGIHWNKNKYTGDIWWYVTTSSGCTNCVSAPLQYYMSKGTPEGPWLEPETLQPSTSDSFHVFTLVQNVERSQIHGIKMLPDKDGNMHALIPATHYRSSIIYNQDARDPGDYNLSLTGLFYFPIDYDADGRLIAPAFADIEEFPLASIVDTSPAPAFEAQVVISTNDVFYQPLSVVQDGGLTDNLRYIEQSWDIKEGEPLAAVLPSVFQRTVMYRGAGRSDKYAQDPLVNAPLLAKLQLPGGIEYEWEIDPITVQWAPTRIGLNLPEMFHGSGTATLTLRTEATNGGFGVAVGKKSDVGRYLLNNGSYRTFNEAEGGWTDRPQAQMLVQTSGTPVSAPVITAQPQSLTVVEGGNPGFFVEAEGVGLGYQWKKDGGEILKVGNIDITTGFYVFIGPCLRLENVQKSDGGTYTVDVINQVGSVTSVPVTLTVLTQEEYDAAKPK